MSAIAAPLPSVPRAVYPRVMPLPPSSPQRWSVADFHRLRASGVWDGRRTYLVRGVIWEQGPMNPPHAALVMIAMKAIDRVLPPGLCTRCQLPLVLGLDTDPFPDVAVVSGEDADYLTGHPTSAHLVVEVADATLAEDTSTKAELYASGGVPDYWVVDVNARQLVVFRDPRPFAGTVTYLTTFTLTLSDSVSPLAIPSASVRVSDLIR